MAQLFLAYTHSLLPGKLCHNLSVLAIQPYIFILFLHIAQMSSDGNQTTSTLSITLGRADSGRYLSCRAYNHVLQSEPLEDGWRLDIQCKFGVCMRATFTMGLFMVTIMYILMWRGVMAEAGCVYECAG